MFLLCLAVFSLVWSGAVVVIHWTRNITIASGNLVWFAASVAGTMYFITRLL